MSSTNPLAAQSTRSSPSPIGIEVTSKSLSHSSRANMAEANCTPCPCAITNTSVDARSPGEA
eukprot:8416652-Pyramimonas_sp.AAC.1